MHTLASFNGRTVDASSPTIHATAAGAIYGKGIFTTLAIHERDPFLWDKHWNRIESDAAQLGIDLDEFPEATIRKTFEDLIEANAVRNGRARITFFDESATTLWPLETKRRTSMLIMTADFRPVAENFSLTISPHRTNSTSSLAGIKSCNYLEKIIAKDEAKKRRFDEAVRLNERGELTSACMANIFWLKDQKLYTPPLDTGCIPGTTRQFILENLDCKEIAAGVEVLRSADEIFLTSSGIGVVQAANIEGRNLNRERHPIIGVLPSRS
jgi:branched-chain amino acid aminotransferase